MTNRIAAAYDGSTSGQLVHTVAFTPATAGARLILLISSYNSVVGVSAGWTLDHVADGWNHCYAYSRIADGSETSVSITTTGEVGDTRVHAVLWERDDCALRRFQGATSSEDPPLSIVAAVPANLAVGQVFLVLNAPDAIALPKVTYNQGLAQYRAVAGDGSNSLFAAGNLPAAGNRTYTVSGTDLAGNNPNVLLVVGYGSTDTTAPSSPPNLRTTSITGEAISIAWDAATDNTAVTGYGIYKDGVKQGADQTALTSTLSGLTAGQWYLIEVDARDAAGNRSARTSINVLAVTDTTPPSPPANLRLGGVSHTSATVVWDEASDDIALAGYGIYLDGAKQGTDQTALERTLTGLARGSAHTVGVDAVDTVGHRSPIVELAFSTLADTLPSEPPGLTATAGQETITLAWSAATDDLGIARYDVLLGGEVIAATAPLTLGYVIEELDPGTVYDVAVRAVDDGGGRGPAATVQVATAAASWTPIESPVYRLGGWAGNVRDAHGVEWVVQGEEGWSSTPEPIPLEADLDGGDGAFSGPGTYGQRTVVLEGVAIAPSRVAMLAAQERLTAALHPRQVSTLRVVEAHLSRQAQVRVSDQVEIVDRSATVFEWTISVSAANPRRQAVRGIWREAAITSLPGQASMTAALSGDYPTIPARLQVWGPIRNWTITHQESGLVIRSKPGTVLPADSRYSVEIDLATRLVLAHVPPEVWPEPRPGRGLLAVFPAQFFLQPGPNTLVLAGEPVAGQVGVPRMVAEAIDSWI
ncbi:fibronectin type III domain-containing protein (plasmid) [Streptosporangium sandarakinum]|uniref:fibronectin type III domain-containing protein n=1 Tax=Streptosporangium sandarakinum TaxID=1260955 RepID=UPI003D8C31BD